MITLCFFICLISAFQTVLYFAKYPWTLIFHRRSVGAFYAHHHFYVTIPHGQSRTYLWYHYLIGRSVNAGWLTEIILPNFVIRICMGDSYFSLYHLWIRNTHLWYHYVIGTCDRNEICQLINGHFMIHLAYMLYKWFIRMVTPIFQCWSYLGFLNKTDIFSVLILHDDVIKWKNSRSWPFVRRIHRSLVNSGQWRGALMFSLTCTWINGWVNNREAVDMRRHRAHYDVIVMGNTAIFYKMRKIDTTESSVRASCGVFFAACTIA